MSASARGRPSDHGNLPPGLSDSGGVRAAKHEQHLRNRGVLSVDASGSEPASSTQIVRWCDCCHEWPAQLLSGLIDNPE
eukprot:9867948-Alexandrium_andersonii.AAC.1